MTAIDLIVLGMLIKEPQSAYDIQKLVEYRNISKWVKISTPSIYKKVLQLEEKGFITSEQIKEGKMPEKSVYSITKEGNEEFSRLMHEISDSSVYFMFDFNAVIVNLDNLPPDEQRECIGNIKRNVIAQKAYMERNLREKEHADDIPQMGIEVLRQQYVLSETIEKWIESLEKKHK